jgi:hypothetical protein
VTPAAVHTGEAPQLHQQRQMFLAAAFAAHPERFVRGLPQPPGAGASALVKAAWPELGLSCAGHRCPVEMLVAEAAVLSAPEESGLQ